MPPTTELQPVVIAEDDADDLFLLLRQFKHAGIENPLVNCRDAGAAIAYFGEVLRSENEAAIPCALVTDLILPGMTGLELVAWVRNERRLADVRIVVLSGSENPDHRRQAEELNVDGFTSKFPSAPELKRLVTFGAGSEKTGRFKAPPARSAVSATV